MRKNLLALSWGLIFGIGLIIARMTDPLKIKAFLDVAGNWDASLALVMVGALLTLFIARHFMQNADQLDPQSAEAPAGGKVDAKLIAGAAIFGCGWGLSGFCPGPAVVSLTSGLVGGYVFVSAMLAGMYLFYRLHRSC